MRVPWLVGVGLFNDVPFPSFLLCAVCLFQRLSSSTFPPSIAAAGEGGLHAAVVAESGGGGI